MRLTDAWASLRCAGKEEERKRFMADKAFLKTLFDLITRNRSPVRSRCPFAALLLHSPEQFPQALQEALRLMLLALLLGCTKRLPLSRYPYRPSECVILLEQAGVLPQLRWHRHSKATFRGGST